MALRRAVIKTGAAFFVSRLPPTLSDITGV